MYEKRLQLSKEKGELLASRTCKHSTLTVDVATGQKARRARGDAPDNAVTDDENPPIDDEDQVDSVLPKTKPKPKPIHRRAGATDIDRDGGARASPSLSVDLHTPNHNDISDQEKTPVRSGIAPRNSRSPSHAPSSLTQRSLSLSEPPSTPEPEDGTRGPSRKRQHSSEDPDSASELEANLDDSPIHIRRKRVRH